jgi:hypothetical protein
MKIGDLGIIKWGNGTTSKVRIVDVETYSFMSTDYWLEYLDTEENRPLIHPDYGKEDIIKSQILLPEGLMDLVYEPI